MIHVSSGRPGHSFTGYLRAFSILLISLCLFIAGVREVRTRTMESQQLILADAAKRACVQCYAIEGRYPPSAEYLEEHYGLSIDHERYHVFYSGWASNIMPDITIVPVNEP